MNDDEKISAAAAEKRGGKILLVGYTAADLYERGKHGKKATARWLNDDVVCHTLDIYHRHAIEKAHHARAVCSPHLPEGDWKLVKFRTGPKLMSGELALSLLQEIHLAGVPFELDFVGRERERNDFLDKIKKAPSRVRDFSAKWKASLPGFPALEFTSLPGCFCHRRQDEGGLALAETAARELTADAAQSCAAAERASQGDQNDAQTARRALRVLDMGCGCGLVGFLIATALKAQGRECELVMVDSHSRAIEAAKMNSENFGIPAEIILADNGTPARMDGSFDVFVGNPPYYSDYRIADVFLETARRALRPGGVCFTVCKNAAGLEPVQMRYFPKVTTTKRRGYAVLKSTKE